MRMDRKKKSGSFGRGFRKECQREQVDQDRIGGMKEHVDKVPRERIQAGKLPGPEIAQVGKRSRFREEGTENSLCVPGVLRSPPLPTHIQAMSPALKVEVR